MKPSWLLPLRDFIRKKHMRTSVITSRCGRDKPPLIIIEKAAYRKLLACTRNAILVYIALARFANQHTALAFPKRKLLARQLGGVPFHTDFLSGRVRVGLSHAQLVTRNKQIATFDSAIDMALTELIAIEFIEKGYFANSSSGKRYVAYSLLRCNGHKRTRRLGFLADPFVMIPASLLDEGFFWVWRGHWQRRESLPSDDAIRVMLLALRDRDDLRYGGVNPKQLTRSDGAVDCSHGSWCNELGMTEKQCEAAVLELLNDNYLWVAENVLHNGDGHLIRLTDPPANAPDEVNVAVFRVNA
jgi:hypothetical protein